MNDEDKNGLLKKAKNILQSIRESIAAKLAENQAKTKEIQLKTGKLGAEESIIRNKVLETHLRRTQELDALYPSPYFIKCELKFDSDNANRIFYFAKFSFPEEQIFSWTSPAAAVRFEKPGKFSYQVGDYAPQTGELFSKEQYMISDGKILFMASEALGHPRELVYQEFFSQRKSQFLLPEIVEQMEQAQDKVIRAHFQGSFLISGPAGSGKTTLALHRVAYLLQSPDTAERFKAEDVIVFVQDNSTREYFGQLLPQLGITGVTITTFDQWAKEHLNLLESKFVVRYGATEAEADRYEFAKYQVLRKTEDLAYSKDIFTLLQRAYVPEFPDDLIKLFLRQKKESVLDRFDLTLLMRAFIQTNGGLHKEETIYRQAGPGKIRRIKNKKPLKYSLVVLDEVQNYLPEQISMLRGSADKANALLYVGDLAQQTRLCTIRDWEQVGEHFIEERKVILQKNYRSTKEILEYISALGYAIEIPSAIKNGARVHEHVTQSTEAEIEKIKEIIKTNSKRLIGIMAKLPQYMEQFRAAFADLPNVHVLTINEAQGVEFDIVCLVGVDDNFFAASFDDAVLSAEKSRVNRDLLYVALTRAMNELHVFGTAKLSEILA